MRKASRSGWGGSGPVNGRAPVARRARRERQYQIESLEDRTLLSFTFSYTSPTAASVVDNSSNNSFTIGTTTISDTNYLEYSLDDGATWETDWTGNGGSDVNLLLASTSTNLSVRLDGNSSTINDGVPSPNTGGPASAVMAALTLNAGGSSTGNVLNVDDSQSTNGGDTYTIGGTLFSYLTDSAGGINITEPNPFTGGLTLTGSDVSGNFSYSVFDVLATPTGQTTTILPGSGPFTVDDTVDVGDAGSVSDILGPVTVGKSGTPSVSDLIVDDSSDTASHTMTLAGGANSSTLIGLAPATITYANGALNSLTVDTGPAGEQTLIVDFSAGNPVPIPSLSTYVPGLSFNGGANSSSAILSHSLVLRGTDLSDPFKSEVHNAEDPGARYQYDNGLTPYYGDINYTDALGNSYYIEYTGLQPVYDIVPVADYTFNDYGYPDQSFTAVDAGPFSSGTDSVSNGIAIQSTPTTVATPTFEYSYISNKGDITVNTPSVTSGVPSNGLNGQVDIPLPSDGLTLLSFNTDTGNTNNVSIVALPDLATSYNLGGTGDDVTNILGTGIPLGSGDELVSNGGAGTNTLNYDAGGEVPTVQPDGFGGVYISIPGYGTVDATGYANINISDIAPVTITPGPTRTINGIEGFRLVNETVGTFTVTVPAIILPAASDLGTDASTAPPSPPAGDFTASIDWGDPSLDADAGTITQDASDPSIYYITGTHTFAENGSYTVANTINFAGGTYSTTTLLQGTNTAPTDITFDFAAAATPTTGTSATAVITQGPLAVSAFPIVGTAGTSIASAPIATFIDAGGAAPLVDYSASITIYNSMGVAVESGLAGTIAQNGNAAEYTVTAPAFTLPDAGNYQVVVSVTNTVGATPITVEGASIAYIAGGALTAGAADTLTANTGVPIPPSTVVASFTDSDTSDTASDFTATIDWGDGSPLSFGKVVSTGSGGFNVEGGHTYAEPGTFDTTVVVTGPGGTTLTITGGSVAVTDLAVTLLSAKSGIATEGLTTGQFVLFTFEDPNTLATVADVSAQLAVGGWGDGTPTTAVPVADRYLMVQQIGVDPTSGDPIFEVLGTHTYKTVTPAGTPDVLSVIVTTLGGVSTTLTDPAGDGVTVVDARLSSSDGPEISGVEGSSTGTVLLGSFTSDDPTAPLGDFTATIAWGGAGTGSTTGSITQPGGVGTPFLVSGSYIYSGAGTFAYTVTVDDSGGQSTTISGSAFIAVAPLTAGPAVSVATVESAIYPVPVFGTPIFSGVVAEFTDGNPLPPTGSSSSENFTATISWGDGTAPTAGTIEYVSGTATPLYEVIGSHTYASTGATGTYTIQVSIVESDSAKLTVLTPATVAAVPNVVTGILNPLSDSGKSNTDDITNVTEPNFYGTAQPNSNVVLYETPAAGGAPVEIGHAEASSDGSWSITSNLLGQGTYTITATATDQFGFNPTPAVVITPTLVIDTAAPVITDLTFDRFDATLTVTYADNLSGLDLASITNSAFYHISATPLSSKVHVPKVILPTSILYTPGALPTDPVVVTVVFNKGKVFRGGKYLVIVDSGTGDNGVQDKAGNALDGNYYGPFATGDMLPGGDFVADIYTFHNKILPFVPIADGYVPPVKGIDPPAGSSTTAKHRAKLVVHSAATQRLAAQAAHRRTYDEALRELVGESKSNGVDKNKK
jgi:hypothetical protein